MKLVGLNKPILENSFRALGLMDRPWPISTVSITSFAKFYLWAISLSLIG
jgi:hypothetical protein